MKAEQGTHRKKRRNENCPSRRNIRIEHITIIPAMASKKRDEVGDPGGEDDNEVEPKRPRNDEEEKEEKEGETTPNVQLVEVEPPQANAEETEEQQHRPKEKNSHKWMAYTGPHHSRVGDDFQVALLPSPSDKKRDGGDDEGKEGE